MCVCVSHVISSNLILIILTFVSAVLKNTLIFKFLIIYWIKDKLIWWDLSKLNIQFLIFSLYSWTSPESFSFSYFFLRLHVLSLNSSESSWKSKSIHILFWLNRIIKQQNFVEDLWDRNGDSVVVFSKLYCPSCVNVKELFQQLEATFKAIDLDKESGGGKSCCFLHVNI